MEHSKKYSPALQSTHVGAEEGILVGTVEGTPDGSSEGCPEGSPVGSAAVTVTRITELRRKVINNS